MELCCLLIILTSGQVLRAAPEANDPEGGDAVVPGPGALVERPDPDHGH